MSKDSKAGEKSDVLAERLTNDEFMELLPHLPLNELLLVQVKLETQFSPLFTVCQKGVDNHYVKCAVCDEKVLFYAFLKHLKRVSHRDNLAKVKQFYNALYTYDKQSEKLAKGAVVSKRELEKAIDAANVDLSQMQNYKFQNAKLLAGYIKDAEYVVKKPLKTRFFKNDNMTSEAALPLVQLMQIEFSRKEGEWIKMLNCANVHNSAKYLCVLCQKYCAGILTVNAHMNGLMHKNNQLEARELRLPGNSQINKSCVLRYEDKFSFKLRVEEGDAAAEDETADEEETFEPQELSPKIKSKLETLRKAQEKQVEGEGLIGVEYVVKYSATANDPKAMYECCLCEVALGPARMEVHLIGHNHRVKYCEMHYGYTMKKFKDEIGHVKYLVYLNVIGHLLAKMAAAIEKTHGRSLPYEVSKEEFINKRADVIQRVYNLRHASQQQGPSFTNIVSSQEIRDLIKQNKPYNPMPTNLEATKPRFTTIPRDMVYLHQREHDPRLRIEDYNTRSGRSERSKSPRSARRTSYEREGMRARSRSPHRRIERRTHGDGSNKDIWKLYRKEYSIAASDVEGTYNEYRKNPESHPLYDQEWNRFWRRRKEELVAQGCDHRSYNYQPEWVVFFRQRLEQLFGEELQKAKTAVRRHLNIPLEAEEDSSVTPATSSSSIPPLLSIDTRPPKRPCLDAAQLVSQWNAQPAASLDWPRNDNGNPSSGWGDTSSYAADTVSAPQLPSVSNDGKPNVIHALRIMTALEDHLGSLGTKIMDLLSKALVLEKSYPNNATELEKRVLTTDNCTLLETAMEKLKGILYAGLLDSSKITAFNRVIEYTENLLNHAEQMGWRSVPIEEFSSNSNDKVDLQKLLENMRSGSGGMGGGEMSLTSQKSLPDTLMELMSMQRKPDSDEDELDERNTKPMSNFSNRSSFQNQNSDENTGVGRFKQGMQKQLIETNRSTLSNFDTSLRAPFAFGSASGGGNNGTAGSSGGGDPNNRNIGGRNNFGNMNFNKQSGGVDKFGSRNAPLSGGAGGGGVANRFTRNDVPNPGMQANYSQNNNFNQRPVPSSSYGNNFGNTNAPNAPGNWIGYPNQGNNQRWQSTYNQQPQQFQRMN